MNLRPDQEDAADRLRQGYREGARRQVLCCHTGWGKTVLFSFITKRALANGLRVMICCHRSEILDQISRTLTAVGVPHGTIESGERMFVGAKAQVASIQTLIRRLDKVKEPDFIVCDECHHVVSNTWASVLGTWPTAKVLGVTATPERLDGRGLGEFFERLVVGPKFTDLVAMGVLAKPRYFAPTTVDCTGLHKQAGEFKSGESEALMDKPAIIGDAIQHYRRFAASRKAVAFCVTVKHAEHVAEMFCKAGIPAVSIDGTLTPTERARRLSMLASGEAPILTSCELVSEGFDLPAVGAAILLRPTASLGLFRQQVGRALRMAPGKTDAIVLDHVGNVRRHGPIEEEVEWNLAGGAAKKRREKPLEVHQCPKCYCVFSGSQCPECGEEREIKAREIEQRDGQLQEITAELLARKQSRMEVGRARGYDALVAIEKQRGYRPGWARYVWEARQRKMQPQEA